MPIEKKLLNTENGTVRDVGTDPDWQRSAYESLSVTVFCYPGNLSDHTASDLHRRLPAGDRYFGLNEILRRAVADFTHPDIGLYRTHGRVREKRSEKTFS